MSGIQSKIRQKQEKCDPTSKEEPVIRHKSRGGQNTRIIGEL